MAGVAAGAALGNFLSGMETRNKGVLVAALPSLETSLVEWKPSFQNGKNLVHPTLETSLVEWKQEGERPFPIPRKTLETSLVEWKPANEINRVRMAAHLGNFLSGMETVFFGCDENGQWPLETSLVEWKQLTDDMHDEFEALPWKLP